MARLQAAVIGLIALIITPGYLFYFDVTPKLMVLLLGTAAALLTACEAAGSARKRGSRPAPISILVVLSLLALAASTALSSNAALSLFGSTWRRYGAIAQAVVLVFAWLVTKQNAAGARTILRGVAVAGLIGGAYGIAQYFGWDPLLPAAAYHIGEGVWTIVRPPGALGHASYFATWLLFAAFLSMALAALESRAGWRRMAIAAAAMATGAMLLTGTRAAVLGLAAGIGVWFYWRGFRVNARIARLAIAVVLAATAFYFSPAGWQMRSRARWFIEDPWGGARPRLWLDSLRMGLRRLPTGYGPEVFMAVFPRFESKELARAYPDFAHESPHNILLDALVSQGIAGVVLLIGFCAVGFRAAWRLRTGQPGTPAGTAAALAAALAGGIVSQQFTAFTIPTALMYYTTLALIVALAPAISPSASDRQRRVAWAPAAITAGAALACVYLALRFGIADHALALAGRGLESGDVAQASAQYAVYDRWRLPGTAADLWYSRACLQAAQKSSNSLLRFQALAQAGAAAARATRTAEDPFNAWYNAAALAASQNDAAGAERHLRAAIAARPNWFKPHWMLAEVLRLESRWQEAEAEAEAAVDLNGGKNPEVAHTLRQIQEQRDGKGARIGKDPAHE